MVERRLGSAQDFDREWREALDLGGAQRLIYPENDPRTQFALFEQVKAAEVDRLFSAQGLTGGLVLECGCGAAGMSIYLANRGFRPVAADLSTNALRIARLNARAHAGTKGIERLDTVAADVFSLPFADNSFDVVMSYGLLEHFEPSAVRGALLELVRTLRPGGLFVSDIAHGRFSVRTLGIYISLAGSLVSSAATMRLGRLPAIWRSYLDAYYENDMGSGEWVAALKSAGLQGASTKTCHPFPPLALAGGIERAYVSLMRQCRRSWEWFHRAQPPGIRGLGWLYLVWGVKA
ncbi:MAG: class I SAM-dependent methyltransferase [Chloroflexota bacterium]